MMAFIKMIVGTVATIVAFIIAIKLLAFLLAIIGLALGLIKLAVIVGLFALIAWVIYKIVSPRRAEQL